MMAHSGSNTMHRRFQSTGFGRDRDPKSLPIWKQKMLNSMRSKAKQHREQLLQRLHQQKKNNKHLSPNSKKRSANNTIDSFKRALVENEMKFQFTASPSPLGVYRPEEDYDAETANLSAEQYTEIFAELAGYLEDTELSGLRAEIAKLEEIEADEEAAAMEEVEAADAVLNPHVVYCPLCCRGELEIEYMNHNQPVYGCLCGVKFRPRDSNVSNKMEGKDEEDDDLDLMPSQKQGPSKESDIEHGRRMLKCLKQNIGSLMDYHSNQLRCHDQLHFGVVPQTGYLQSWCTKCHCNEIVI